MALLWHEFTLFATKNAPSTNFIYRRDILKMSLYIISFRDYTSSIALPISVLIYLFSNVIQWVAA